MMVLQPAKFPGARKGSRAGKRMPTEELAKQSRPMLHSLEIPTLLEKERSGAFFNQVFKPLDSMQREFSSYYLCSTTKSKGSYLLTSHENPTPMQQPVISAYSTLVKDFQWDPCVQSAKIVAYEDTGVAACEESSALQDSAECKDYNSKHGSKTKFFSRVLSNHRKIFKDNIMKFNDQGTMTRNLSNASCGSRHAGAICTSDAAVSATHVAIQLPENTPLHSYVIPQGYMPQEQGAKEYPPPILKKSMKHPFQSKFNKYVKLESVLSDINAERDVVAPAYPVSDYEPIPSSKKGYKEIIGKVLYNEGIDDSMKQNYILPMRIPLPVNVEYDKSKVLIGKCFNEAESEIPYSHRSESKYHSGCMEPTPRRRRVDGNRKRISSRTAINYQNGINQIKNPSGPKRVLSSDQDIDAFIELNVPKLVVPKRKK